MLFPSTVAGSLPKPSWLAEPNKLWPQWRLQGEELAAAKLDATLLAVKWQEDAGIDIVCDGEMSRQHFVHGFLEFVDGIDFAHKVEMGIRADRYKAMVPQVVGALALEGRVHEPEAKLLRASTTRTTKFTLPGPMTIVDTVADRHYGDRVKLAFAFADLLNQEALALQADGVDVIQFDEPAFNVFFDEVRDWGVRTLERAAEGLGCTTAVHICYGYGIQANIDWKKSLGGEWRQYEQTFPLLAASAIDQVSLECANSHVPMELMALLQGKDVMVGVIDVAFVPTAFPRMRVGLRGLEDAQGTRFVDCSDAFSGEPLIDDRLAECVEEGDFAPRCVDGGLGTRQTGQFTFLVGDDPEIDALAEDSSGVSLAQLSVKLKLHKSTVHRLLAVLEQHGCVERNPESGKHFLGPKLLELGARAMAKQQSWEHARFFLERLVGWIASQSGQWIAQ